MKTKITRFAFAFFFVLGLATACQEHETIEPVSSDKELPDGRYKDHDTDPSVVEPD